MYERALFIGFAGLVLVAMLLAHRAARLVKTRYPNEWEVLLRDREIMPLNHGLEILLKPARVNEQDTDLRFLVAIFRVTYLATVLVWLAWMIALL